MLHSCARDYAPHALLKPPRVQAEAQRQPGVIQAAAKRAKQSEDFVVTAAQVALMGGQWKPNADKGWAHSFHFLFPGTLRVSEGDEET